MEEREPLVRDENERPSRSKGHGRLHRVAAAESTCVARLLVRHEAALLAQLRERHHGERKVEGRHARHRTTDAPLLLGDLALDCFHSEHMMDVDTTSHNDQRDDDHQREPAADGRDNDRPLLRQALPIPGQCFVEAKAARLTCSQGARLKEGAIILIARLESCVTTATVIGQSDQRWLAVRHD